MRRIASVVAIAIGLVVAWPVAHAVYPASNLSTGIAFNADQALVNLAQPSGLGVQSLEPGIKTDSAGDIYVNAIRGVPAGTDIWKTTTALCQNAADNQCPINYEGQPEGLFTTGVGTGGGDIDMAVGAPYQRGGLNSPNCTDPNSTPPNPGPCSGSATGNLYMASLTAANQTAVTCKDGNLAVSSCLLQNPASTAQTDEDREWLTAEGAHTAYLSYHVVGPQSISVCKSTNDGQTYTAFGTCSKADVTTPAQSTANNRIGNILTDQTSSTHYLYQIFSSVATAQQNVDGCPLNTVWMAVSTDNGIAGTLGLVWTDHMIFQSPVNDSGSPVGGCTGTRTDTLFPVVAVDNVGNVYAEWSDGINVFYESSSDHGTTWDGKTDGTGPPTQVSLPFGPADCTNTTGPVCGLHTALFPWMAATGNGHVDFVWYGSPTTTQPTSTVPNYGNATSPWSVFFAETFNGLANVNGNSTAPIIYQTVANKDPNHIGPICISGTTCLSGRTLGDFFQVAIEQSTSCAVIAYANDRAMSGTTALPTKAYFNRQLGACVSPPTSMASTILHRGKAVSARGYIQLEPSIALPRISGYDVYIARVHGKLQRLNSHLIVGHNVTPDLLSQASSLATRGHARWFFIQRVQSDGRVVRFGPYLTSHHYL